MDSTAWLGAIGLDLTARDDPDRPGEAGDITFSAAASTDWFHDPRTGSIIATAPIAVVVTGVVPVTVSCRVAPTLRSTFDAAALFIHHDDDHWVKFAIERSPAGDPTLVSVHTAGRSDDCNHQTLPASEWDLRVTLDAHSLALHARRAAGEPWELARYCARPAGSAPTIGVLVQSPTGDGATGRFADIRVELAAVAELRDGS